MNTEEEKYENVICKINDVFKTPLYYNKEKIAVNPNIITDLELINTVDLSNNSIYSFFFNHTNPVSKKITEQITEYYTTDIPFLEDTQKLISEYSYESDKYSNYNDITNIWYELKIENGFKEKYCYVDFSMIEFLNKSELFLQFISMYNLFSPILSLLVPVLILIIPFIILQMKGISLSLKEYINVLKVVAETNAIGKLFTSDFKTIKYQDGLYIFISAIFYLFSIYQNIMVCIRFNNNMKTIHSHFKEIKTYLNKTITSMNNYLSFSKKLESQKEFNEIVENKIQTLNEIYGKICSISEYNIYNFSKLKEIGNVLKYFYELHSDNVYEEAILYSIGFNGYLDCIQGLQENIREKKINCAIFYKNKKNYKKNIFKKSYYACLNNNPVKNTIKFNKNLIITGPNASGKTTILKSTLINIILTQQFGCGFYDSAKCNPFKYIHCYLNIPDTSGRDSLFQAEARRCKDILDIIDKNKHDTHFCVFDELYSGTNPEEAEKSATSFMSYLQKYTNVRSFLTTHFVKVCKKLNAIKSIKNCKMVTNIKGDALLFTYKLEKGISNVKGGINILTELNYPKEIIKNAF
jgi:hypothetical protein